jgi:hypothetical protein
MVSGFGVNEKSWFVTACVFNRVQAVHRPLTGIGAADEAAFAQMLCGARLGADFWSRRLVCSG